MPYTKYRSNIKRGLYDLNIKATNEYEKARGNVAKLLNAKPKEIIFTSGTTHGLNALAYSLSSVLSHRDNVVLTRAEHHSNLVPWQQMQKHYGFGLRFVELADDFSLDLESAKKVIDENTKIISFTLASNVLGTITPAQEIVKLSKPNRAITIIDAAQAAAHVQIDVKVLDCDFLLLSAHKMYGPTGIGVMYGKKVMLEEHLEPFFFGGEMVNEVTFGSASWSDVPNKHEAGTPNIAGAIGLGAAAKFIMNLGWDKINKHELGLTQQLINELQNIGARIIGPNNLKNRIGVVSFNLPGVHPHDIAEVLNKENICIRAGTHCTMPLHQYLDINSSARASVGVYNTKEDISKLITGLKKVKKVFKP
jgi:cysteine desulfurase / selenocysteine lyase